MKAKLLRKLRREARVEVLLNVRWYDVADGKLTRLSFVPGSGWIFKGWEGMATTWDRVGHDLARLVERNIWRERWRDEWRGYGYGGRLKRLWKA